VCGGGVVVVARGADEKETTTRLASCLLSGGRFVARSELMIGWQIIALFVPQGFFFFFAKEKIVVK
jgi:hypothetical protein